MSDLIQRTWNPLIDLEVRAGGDGRTVYGLAVPYDSPTPIRDSQGEYLEVFRMGAFKRDLDRKGVNKVKMLFNHDRLGGLLGVARELREDAAGLVGEFYIPKSQRGDEVLEFVREGVLDSFSIGFQPRKDKWNEERSFVERIEASLHEVSIVAFPAYEAAEIAGLRADETLTPADGPVAAPSTATNPDGEPAQPQIYVPRNRTRLAAYLKGIQL